MLELLRAVNCASTSMYKIRTSRPLFPAFNTLTQAPSKQQYTVQVAKLASWRSSSSLAGGIRPCQLAAHSKVGIYSKPSHGSVVTKAEITGGLIYSAEILAIIVATGIFFTAVNGSKKEREEKPPASSAQWKDMSALLREKRVTSLSAYEVKSLVLNAGYSMLDVRPSEVYKERHPRGAINVPLFEYPELLEKVDSDTLRSAILVSQGLTPTRENPNFLAQLEAAVPAGNAIVLMDDNSMGTLNPSGSQQIGQQSRALIAAYLIVKGVEGEDARRPIAHLEGGVDELYEEGFPQDPRPGV
mmetsp:Transcript_16926/g.23377  ORF Transcript_16926/g.23377 Transcript_16926/m.23377 type:complete len:300 (-) Transcript_16926:1-900(-)